MTIDNATVITISKTSGNGTLSGTTTRTVVNGVAMGLAIGNRPSSGWVSSAARLTGT